MSKFTIIKAELDSNPSLYGSMTDQEVADELNAIDKVQQRTSIPGSELFGYTDQTEFDALSDAKKQQWLGLCGIDTITKDAVSIVKSIFGVGTTTWSNIVKTYTVSRADILGISYVYESNVIAARSL